MAGNTTRTAERVKPDDIVSEAKRIVDSLEKDGGRPKLTTSQIRKFLAAVNAIDNRVQVWKSEEIRKGSLPAVLPDELYREIQLLKVKLVYQAGREKLVKDFVEKSDMLTRIDKVGHSPEEFERLARLVEAITAYHRYEGGRD